MSKDWVPFNLAASGAPIILRASAITKVTTTGIDGQTLIFGNWPAGVIVLGTLLEVGKKIQEAEEAGEAVNKA